MSASTRSRLSAFSTLPGRRTGSGNELSRRGSPPGSSVAAGPPGLMATIAGAPSRREWHMLAQGAVTVERAPNTNRRKQKWDRSRRQCMCLGKRNPVGPCSPAPRATVPRPAGKTRSCGRWPRASWRPTRHAAGRWRCAGQCAEKRRRSRCMTSPPAIAARSPPWARPRQRFRHSRPRGAICLKSGAGRECCKTRRVRRAVAGRET